MFKLINAQKLVGKNKFGGFYQFVHAVGDRLTDIRNMF